jgi:ATP-dependent helicase/nuclease subunit A
VSSFLDLLIPVLCSQENPPFTIEEIPAYTRDELERLRRRVQGNPSGEGPFQKPAAMGEAAARAAAFYAQAELIRVPPPVLWDIPASSLDYQKDAVIAAPGKGSPGPEGKDPLDGFLKQAGLDVRGFGTIVHSCIEAKLSGRRERIPLKLLALIDEQRLPQVQTEARIMAEGFLGSPLGTLALGAAYREAEFPFLTALDSSITITGQIDLLFETPEAVHVADFKTDRIEEPEKHLGQLAAYARAAGDLFGKPVRAWLFYLRSGRAVELTGSLETVNIEALARR